MKLIPEWKRAWRFLSMRVAAGAVVFGLLPPDQQAAILAAIGIEPGRIPAVIGGLFMAGRLLAQENKA